MLHASCIYFSIVTKKAELIDGYEGALKCIEERQTALKNSLEFQQFRRDVEEVNL